MAKLRYIKSITTQNVSYRAGYSEIYKKFVIHFFVNELDFIFPLENHGYSPVIEGKKFSSIKKGAEYLVNNLSRFL